MSRDLVDYDQIAPSYEQRYGALENEGIASTLLSLARAAQALRSSGTLAISGMGPDTAGRTDEPAARSVIAVAIGLRNGTGHGTISREVVGGLQGQRRWLMSKMSSWLKAGLLGAAVVVVLQVVGIIPCVGCVTWILTYVAYGCFGALAAYWLPPRRLGGPAAGQGALAGAIAGAIGGAVSLILALGVTAVFVPLGVLGEALEGTGLDPSALWEAFATVVGSLTCGTGCYALGVGIAAGLGALGGLIFAAIQPE